MEGAQHHARKNKGKEREDVIATPPQTDDTSSDALVETPSPLCTPAPIIQPGTNEPPLKESLKKSLEKRDMQHEELVQCLKQIYEGIMMVHEELKQKK